MSTWLEAAWRINFSEVCNGVFLFLFPIKEGVKSSRKSLVFLCVSILIDSVVYIN